jgi:DNA-binding CsgD family transcriptional regulator
MWPTALAAFSRAIGGAGAHLVVVDKNNVERRLGGTPRFKTLGVNTMDPNMGAQYMDHWRTMDPLLPAALGSTGPPGTILLCHEFLDDTVVAKSPYFQEFLIPGGGRFQAGVTLENDQTRVVMLDLHLREEPISREKLERWNYVFDHLRRSIRLSVRLADQHTTNTLLRSAIDSQGIACVMIDHDLHVIDHSAAAKKLLAQGDVLRMDLWGKISLADVSKCQQFKAIVEAACRGGGGNTLQVGAAKAHAVLIQVSPVGVTSQNPFDLRASNCALVFAATQVASADSFIHRIRSTFPFSASEAEVGAALSAGLSPDEIALTRGTSIQTVRTQIRSLLSKAECSRTSQLIAKLVLLRPRQ